MKKVNIYVLLTLVLYLAITQVVVGEVKIDQTPVLTRNAITPNILFILDDSGSMDWEYLPESISSKCSDLSDHVYCRSSHYNKIYYNPDVSYELPLDADGNDLGDSDIDDAWDNGFDLDGRDSDTTDLSGKTYYVYDSSASGCGNDIEDSDCYTRVSVSSLDTEDQVNYANWYSYYRSRLLTAKTAVSIAFNGMDDNYRLGYGSINEDSSDVSGVDSTIKRDVREFSVIRDDFYDWLFELNASGWTPLRRALDAAGQYYSQSHPYQVNPESVSQGYLSCRQNYTILSTDGYWNRTMPDTSGIKDTNVDNLNGSEISSNDGETYQYLATDPFRDDQDNTLADIAMYYWKNDLRSDLVNDVPVNNSDPAFWQHMVTFGMGIGVQGNIDPEFAFQSIGAETAIDWGDASLNNSAAKIDDLLHAAVNSRGDYFSANDPAQVQESLFSSIKDIVTRVYSGTTPAISNQQDTGDRYVYRASFNSGDWSGDLTAFNYNDTQLALGAQVWDASFPTWTDRKLYTLIPQGSNQKGVEFLFDEVDAAIKSGLKPSSDTTDEELMAIIDYLSGDRVNEKINSGTFRSRNNGLLGDIVNSSPLFVNVPDAQKYRYNDWSEASSHSSFASQYAARPPMIYAGANDGMLHGFDATTGVERFSYIPREILTRTENNLSLLTNSNYIHKYYVDGMMAVADVYINNGWKTVLIGSLGRGGKSVFALDVTDPQNFDEDSILWEVSGAEFGNILSKPVIAKVESGKWLAILGNGYNSSGETAQLIAIDISTGDYIAIDTGEGGVNNSNGLAGPFGWDDDVPANNLTDTVYAGDLLGNIWQFDLSSLTFNGNNNITPVKLFTAADSEGNAQPVTVSLTGAEDDNGDLWLFGGTGKLLSSEDILDNSGGSFSGSSGGGSSGASGTTVLIGSQTLDDNEARDDVSPEAQVSADFTVTTAGTTLEFTATPRDHSGSDEFTYEIKNQDISVVVFNGSTEQSVVNFSETLAPANYRISLVANDHSSRNIDYEVDISNVVLDVPAAGTSYSDTVVLTSRLLDDNQKEDDISSSAKASASFTVTEAGTLLSFSAQTDNCKGSDYFKYVVTDTDSGGVEFSASTKNDVDFSEVLSPANYSVYFEANDLSKKNVKCQVTLSDVILSTPVSGSGGGSGDSGTSSAGIQSWYGLKVAGAVSATRDNLKQRTLETAQAVGTDYNARIVSAVTQGDMSGFSGWYIDFDLESAPGERMVFPNQIRHNAEKSLIGTTVIPSDGYCSSSLDGFVMAIDPFTGGRLNDTYFDYNGDSTLSDGDLLTYTDAEGNEVQIKGSGISFKDATSKPIFIKDKMISQLTDNSIKVVTVQGPGNGEGNAEILYWREVR